jgi:DNA invertase Pin-like site-specific DNA recombinase
VGWPMSKKVIELIRVSTEAQAAQDRAGIPAQRAANQRTSAQYGLEIVRTIEFADVSGAAVLRSPEIEELVRLMESPEIHGVVAKEFSRLMRPENFADYALLQVFVDTSSILYLPDGPIDFRSKSGRFLGTIRAAMAGLERTEILERVWGAKEEKRRAGKHAQSYITLPYATGYDAKSQRWFFKPEVEKVCEAFRLLLAGESSYKGIGREVGIDPFNLRIIMRNPIYTGWRVYTERRDPSGIIKTKTGGRQSDRPKVKRSPEDIIRVKVLDPVVTEEDFQKAQQIMDLKKQNHWRVRPDFQRRFTYSGFLRCGTCRNLVYTHAHKPRDWYVCKSRTWPERKLRQEKGLAMCDNPYMRRERLEESIDRLFAERLTDRTFIDRLVLEYGRSSDSTERLGQLARVQHQLTELSQKRQRVLEAYFENLIDRAERDRRLTTIERDLRFYGGLSSKAVSPSLKLSAEDLAHVLGPLYEWKFLTRADKRHILQAVVPEIHVRDHKVVGLSLISDLHDNEMTHTGRGSSPPRA